MEINKTTKSSEAVRLEMIDEDKRVIGRASLFLIFNDLHDKPYGLMEDVFVEEEFRGKGFGTQLVNEVIKLAKEKDCYKLITQSRHSNKKVHGLYKKIGFKEHGLNFRIDF